MNEKTIPNENDDSFIFKLFMGSQFESLVPNLGEMSFSKRIELKRTIVGLNGITLLGLNFLSGELITKAKELFVDFALEQIKPREIKHEDLEKEITEFEKESFPGKITQWDGKLHSKIPEGIIILSNNRTNTIILDSEESEKNLKGKELTLKLSIGFDKEWVERTKAVKVLKII